jgi:glycosyltransferase involved in cell wall biosynthesis
MERAFAELIRRMPAHFRVVVISSDLAPSLRPLVDWRRVRVPTRPFPLRFLAFFVLGGIRLRSVRSDLVHTLGAIVPNRVDVAEVQFCHAGFVSATGHLAPSDAPNLRRLNTAVVRLLSIAAERWCYRPKRLRGFVAVSRGIGVELDRAYPGIPFVVAANGVDLDRFRPDAEARRRLRAELRVPDEDLVVLFVGGDWNRKGLPIVVEALVRVPRARLWVVGSGDSARLETRARRLGVEDRIRFFGARTDGERFYGAADVFCLPSLYEAFPLVGLEAAAAGLPLVATRVSGIEDLVVHGKSGLLVERTNEAVGDALTVLFADSDLRRRMGVEARDRVSGYTWEQSVDAVAQAYDQLLGDGELESA